MRLLFCFKKLNKKWRSVGALFFRSDFVSVLVSVIDNSMTLIFRLSLAFHRLSLQWKEFMTVVIEVAEFMCFQSYIRFFSGLIATTKSADFSGLKIKICWVKMSSGLEIEYALNGFQSHQVFTSGLVLWSFLGMEHHV